MKKYTDSQILRTIIKQCKRDIEYHNEKVTELGKKKLELIKKREYFEKPVIWGNITNQIINHNLACSQSQRILDEINDMRKEQVKEK